MTYALLIYRTAPSTQPIPELEERAALAAHRNLQAEARASGELGVVARLSETATAHTVKRRAGAHDVADGPFIESKEWLVGFYLVDCETVEQAIVRAKAICTDEHHAIEVRPVTWQWSP